MNDYLIGLIMRVVICLLSIFIVWICSVLFLDKDPPSWGSEQIHFFKVVVCLTFSLALTVIKIT